jgi:transcriptional regulator with XRE-family HTH domain
MDGTMSIGRRLRARREERGLSVDQAAFQSRVPVRLVDVLESDDYRLVPDAFYLIRVLHDYARFLGLDPDEAAQAFRRAVERQKRPAAALGVPAPAPPPVSWRSVAWTVAAVLAVVPLVFIALSLSAQRESATRPAPPGETPRAAEKAGATPAAPAVPPEEPAPAEGPAADDLPAPTAAAPAAEPLREPGGEPAARPPRRWQLVAEALEPTWMAVQSDGGEPRQVLLQRGERTRFGADTGFVLTVGNAGGVRLALNGERLPVLGKSGEVVRNLILPPPGGVPDAAPGGGR